MGQYGEVRRSRIPEHFLEGGRRHAGSDFQPGVPVSRLGKSGEYDKPAGRKENSPHCLEAVEGLVHLKAGVIEYTTSKSSAFHHFLQPYEYVQDVVLLEVLVQLQFSELWRPV